MNYIYAIYNEYINLNKLINKKKIKKIFLFFSSTSKINSFERCKWEWAPHIFSIIDYYGLSEIRKLKIKRKFNNFYLKIIFKNQIQINCIYGNNFLKKIRYQKIYLSNNKTIKVLNNNLIINKSVRKFKKTPVEVLIEDTIKVLKKLKKFHNKDLHKTLIYNKYIHQLKL